MKILLLGLRRSGKSSIQKVVFHSVSPNETLFLDDDGDNTNTASNDTHQAPFEYSQFMHFQIGDIPNTSDLMDELVDMPLAQLSDMFSDVGAVVFVVDVQDDYIAALSRLFQVVTRTHKVNPALHFEVFLHKIDGLSDDHKIETQRDINQRLTDELADAAMDHIQLAFYLTSIYDHSIFEAFSKVIQKLIPQLPSLENLLNALCSHSCIEKAFLFDVMSKIYIATDSSPVDMQTYELCSDMIDVTMDISSIYSQSTLMDTSKPMSASNISSSNNNNTLPFDDKSASVIRLNNGMVLYLRQATETLAVVCLLRADNFGENRGLMECNIGLFRKAVKAVFQIHQC